MMRSKQKVCKCQNVIDKIKFELCKNSKDENT